MQHAGAAAGQAYDKEGFADFLARGKRRLIKAQRADVGRFLQQLLGNGVDGRSVGRKLSALRQFYRFLLLDRRIEHDPTLNIESPRQWKVLPKSLSRDEVEATLSGSQPLNGSERALALAQQAPERRFLRMRLAQP